MTTDTTKTTPIILTNSANITIGMQGPDTLENVEDFLAENSEPAFDSDGEPQYPYVIVDYEGWVWVTFPESWDDGHQPECSERVGYVIGSDAQTEAETNN